MASEAKSCESCGMPMPEAKYHGAGDVNNLYCVYCTDEKGKLKTRGEVREGMVHLYMAQMGKSREEAERFVDQQMRRLPAWKGR